MIKGEPHLCFLGMSRLLEAGCSARRYALLLASEYLRIPVVTFVSSLMAPRSKATFSGCGSKSGQAAAKVGSAI